MLVELASGWNPWLPPIPEAVGELFKVLVAVVKTQVVPRAALTAENLAPGATTDFA